MAEGEDTGVSAQGSMTADRVTPQDIDLAFATNENIDPGSMMPEAGLVPFHNDVAGTKLAQAGRLAALRDLGLLKIAESAAGLPGGTPTTKTYKPIKPVGAFDPRTDKPEGYNLTSGVQTMSNGADVNDSYGAFGRRLQGSPV